MKKTLLFALLIINFLGFGQFVPSAPWVKDIKKDKNQEISIDELTSEFNNYWLNHDKDKKGSGYKPYMRWENHWRNKTNTQGYLITPQEMWEAFNLKKAARNNSSSSVPTSIWEPVGPLNHINTGSWSSGQGRVNVVYVDPSNENTIYIGTPAGGIWKSTTGGTNWIPLSDNLPQIGVSGIAVDPTNSDIIYIATGDKDGSDSYSIGVMKSIDGGLTWNTTGLSFTNTNTFAGDIVINPTNVNELLVATSDGIYKTSNAGATWSQVRTGSFSQGTIRLKPNNPNTVYAVSNNRFVRSTNFGSTFTTITSGLPTNSSRMLLDVTPADENVIYILSVNSSEEFQGLYKSTDGGNSFVTSNNGSTDIFESYQAWYDLALAVSSTNADEVYTGCLNVWRSLNGGTSFTKRNNWSSPTSPKYTHADIHFLRYFGNKLFCGSDGGVYVSTDNSASFTDLTASAQISQFYRIAVSRQSASKMVGGLQDNGGHALSNNQWKNYYGADGMDTAIDPNNSNLFYGFIQNGSSLYMSNNAGNSSSGGVGSPNGQSGNWITPLVTNSVGEVYAGYSDLYRLDSGNWVQQNTTPLGIGNLAIIKIDPSNDNIIYVSSGSEILKSTDKGLTFQPCYDANSSVTSIAVHSSNSNIVYITTQGTSGQALKSTNGGLSFTYISNGLPNIGKNVIVHQGRNAANPLFVGTSLGVYYKDDTMSQWQPFDSGLPNVSVTDLEINLEDQKIIAATYGRGIWQAAIEVEVPQNDLKVLEILNLSSTNIECTSSLVAPQINIKNSGATAINNVDFNYSYNDSNYQYSWNGTLNPNQNIAVTLPEISLPKDLYNFNVTAIAISDEVSENNTSNKSFVINTSGTFNELNTFETLEDKLLSYDESGLFSTWQRGTANSVINSGTNNVYASNLTGNYDDNRKAFLVSECYDITQMVNPMMTFKMAHDLEENWDILYLQYTTDNGAHWYRLGEMASNWYNSDRTPETTGNDCNNCIGGQWTGTNTTLTEYSYSLYPFLGFPNVIFRFVFHSDGNVTGAGVVVDDFLISGTNLATTNFELDKLAIYPNPSNGIFNISVGNISIDSIDLYDITGKKIDFKTNKEQTVIDLSAVSDGVYFVKITSNNQSTTKKIIKK